MRTGPLAQIGQCRTVLVVAPHSDDETIGAYALTHALRRRGAAVRVVVVTDGGASHPASVAWPPERLIAARRRETLAAMAILGIARDRVRFLDLPDGMLAADAARLDRGLRRACARMPAPDLVVGPVADDAHADHRAVAAALWGMRGGTRRLGYRVWPLDAARGRLAVPLPARLLAAKRRALRAYRTQNGAIIDSPTGMAIRAHHRRAFAGPIERFERLR